ncbi:MAG: invasin domain 3-containing protein [Armatimonadota bacterium]|nr:hypothetical protein [bacterium]
MRRILTVIAVFAMCAPASDAALNDYSMWLRAQPEAIVADSFSATTITAEVRDESGDAVEDGTQVEFTTNLGIIEPTARTESGVARVRLQSETTVGTALVSAVVEGGKAVAQLNVDFLAPGTEMFDESFISVSSDKHLGYDVGTKTVDAAGGVKIYSRGLTITAEEAQIDVKNNILRARARLGGDNIIIERGDKSISASAFYYSFKTMSGVLLTPADDGARRLLFRGRDMFTQPDEEPDAKIKFDFEPIAQSNMFIRARSMLISPGKEIKIKRANFYMEGDKVLSVPLHVVPLSGDSSGVGQIFTYGTEGMSMNLPIYYSLTPNGTGSVRVRHSDSSTGWNNYGGWRVNLEQEYTSGASTEGKVAITRVTSGDWGLNWNNRSEYDDDSRLYTYIDFPSHKNLYSTIDYNRPLGDYTFSMNVRGTKRTSYDPTYSSSAYIQSKSKPLLANGAVSYAYTTRLTYNNSISSDEGSKTSSAVGLQFYGKSFGLGQGRIGTSATVQQEWGGSSPGKSVYANVGYSRSLSTIGSFSTNYTYSFADAESGYNAQRISTSLSLRPSRLWSSNLYLTYRLDNGNISAYGKFGYSILTDWRLGVETSYQKLSYSDYSDAEFSLSRAFGRQEGSIIWSQSRKRFRVEFTALSF